MTYDDVLYRFPSRNSLTAPIDAFATVTRVTCDRRVLILNSILKVYSPSHYASVTFHGKVQRKEFEMSNRTRISNRNSSQKFPKNCQLIRSTRPLSALCRVASNSEYAPVLLPV